MVSRNLLGDESYRWFIDRLGDNDPVLLVVSRGASPESTREPVWVGRWKERW